MSEVIDRVKQFFESEAGGQFLLTALSGAKTRENMRRYSHYEEPTYCAEREADMKMEARKQELLTPKPITAEKTDVLELIRFNRERPSDDEWKELRIVHGKCHVFSRQRGVGVPDHPLLSGSWDDLIRDGRAVFVDTMKQHWDLSLVE